MGMGMGMGMTMGMGMGVCLHTCTADLCMLPLDCFSTVARDTSACSYMVYVKDSSDLVSRIL
ncbi:hypothetical protein EON63_11120 [archaeon]|nr:MAG: hypothetical protein EON63_11120 [archaeon]